MSFPLDLHVLGLPPAFNLSHDQTLQLKFCCSFDSNGSMNTVNSHTEVMNELTVLSSYSAQGCFDSIWSLSFIDKSF